jgi:hypothetical protein
LRTKHWKKYLKTAWSAAALFAFSLCAYKLPAGTTLEVRLSTPTGSRISHAGDQVEASTIAPISFRGQILVPQASQVFGSVESVKRFGLGLKHITASIHYRFDTVRLTNGDIIAVQTEVLEVETAKERVDVDGTVRAFTGCNPVLEFGLVHDSPFVCSANRRDTCLGHKIRHRAFCKSGD